MIKPVVLGFAALYLGLGTGTLALDEHARKEWREKAQEGFALAVGVAVAMWTFRRPEPPLFVPQQPEASKKLHRLIAEEQLRAAIASVLLVALVVPWRLVLACCDAGVTCGIALGVILTVPVAVSSVAGKE